MPERWTSRASTFTYFLLVYGVGGLCLVGLVAPVVIALLMSLTSGNTLQFPPPGLSLRWYIALFDPVVSHQEQIAAWNTVKIAVLTVVVSLIFAVPASYGMVRIRARTANAIEPLFLAPLVLPSLVFGLGLLITANLLGISPSTGLVVVGHVVVFGPLMYRATAGMAARLDPSLEEASSLLGATRLGTFRRVTLPLLLPGILAGVFLVFMQSIDNVTITLFLASPETTILPLRMFAMLEDALDPRIAAISGVLIGLAVLVLIGVQRLAPMLRTSQSGR
jgi:putative spermidine/putrescine transport system permease protein